MTLFKIRCELQYAVNGTTEFLFGVLPARNAQQSVESEWLSIKGASGQLEYSEHIEPGLGNRIVRTHAHAGSLQLHYQANLVVMHLSSPPGLVLEHDIAQLPMSTFSYLLPSRYCHSDRMSGIARREFGSLPRGYQRVEAVCDWVHKRMRFAPGSTNSTTSAEEALTQGAGVCRDFAHVVITLLRALNIPARFVTGYDYGVDPIYGPTDFHAYVEAFLGNRWWIFDATRMAPRNGLVRIATGRDAADCAFATLFGPTCYVGMQIEINPIGTTIVDDRGVAYSTAGAQEAPSRVNPAPYRTDYAAAA